MPVKPWRARFLTLSKKLRDPRQLLIVGAYAATLWICVAFLGYGIALRNFADTPRRMLSFGEKRAAGPITSLIVHGFGPSRQYRIRVQHSEEFTIPSQLAYPLWPGNPEPNRLLSDLLVQGQEVVLTSTGDPYLIVLDLSVSMPGGKQEKLLDHDTSMGRYGALQTEASREATVYEILAALLLTLLVARFGWARRSRRLKSRG